MSDSLNNDGTPKQVNCKLYIKEVGKTVSMDLPVIYIFKEII